MLLSEKSQPEKATNHIISTLKIVLKRQNYRVKRSVARGYGQGGMKRPSADRLYGGETILYEAVMLDACHYAFV